jgi:hypothetical protein
MVVAVPIGSNSRMCHSSASHGQGHAGTGAGPHPHRQSLTKSLPANPRGPGSRLYDLFARDANYIGSRTAVTSSPHDDQSVLEICSGKAGMGVGVASRCLRKQNAISSSRPKARLSGGTPCPMTCAPRVRRSGAPRLGRPRSRLCSHGPGAGRRQTWRCGVERRIHKRCDRRHRRPLPTRP